MHGLLMTFILLPALVIGAATHARDRAPVKSSRRALETFPITAVDSPRPEKAHTPGVPNHLDVRQNFPNPFNTSTTIEFDLPTEASVYAAVYNTLGKRIRTLDDNQRGAGTHLLEWNGTTDSGETLASGVYFYVLIANGYYAIHKMILLK